ncbi:MAG: hypothetical protein FWH26_00695, partial [Oscillospiraceae bacterium]|nr:hypothetical protein [Oscillospiraceae bacterium]
MKYFKKSLSVLLAFCLLLGVLIVGINAEGNTVPVERGLTLYYHDGSDWAELNGDEELEPGTQIKATAWVEAPGAYLSNLTALVYFDSDVYELKGGYNTPKSYFDTVPDSSGVYSVEAGSDALFSSNFEWSVAYPPSISEMEVSSNFALGAGAWHTYYPMAWFDKVTANTPPYPDYSTYTKGHFGKPLLDDENNYVFDKYRVIAAKGEFPLAGMYDEDACEQLGAGRYELISFYLQLRNLDQAQIEALPEGAGKIGLPNEAMPGFVVGSQTWEGGSELYENLAVLTLENELFTGADGETAPAQIFSMGQSGVVDSLNATAEDRPQPPPAGQSISPESSGGTDGVATITITVKAPEDDEFFATFVKITGPQPAPLLLTDANEDGFADSILAPALAADGIDLRYGWFTQEDVDKYGLAGSEAAGTLAYSQRVTDFSALAYEDHTFIEVGFATYYEVYYYENLEDDDYDSYQVKSAGVEKVLGYQVNAFTEGRPEATAVYSGINYNLDSQDTSLTLSAVGPNYLKAFYNRQRWTYTFKIHPDDITAGAVSTANADWEEVAANLKEGATISAPLLPALETNFSYVIGSYKGTDGEAYTLVAGAGVTGPPAAVKTFTLYPEISQDAQYEVKVTYQFFEIDGITPAKEDVIDVFSVSPENEGDSFDLLNDAEPNFDQRDAYLANVTNNNAYVAFVEPSAANLVIDEDAEFVIKLKARDYGVTIVLDPTDPDLEGITIDPAALEADGPNAGKLLIHVPAKAGAPLQDLINTAIANAIGDGVITEAPGKTLTVTLDDDPYLTDGVINPDVPKGTSFTYTVGVATGQSRYSIRVDSYLAGEEGTLTAGTPTAEVAANIGEETSAPIYTIPAGWYRVDSYVNAPSATTGATRWDGDDLYFTPGTSNSLVVIEIAPIYEIYEFYVVTTAVGAAGVPPTSAADFELYATVKRNNNGSLVVTRPTKIGDLNFLDWLEDDLDTVFNPAAVTGAVATHEAVIQIYSKWTDEDVVDYDPIRNALAYAMEMISLDGENAFWAKFYTEEFITLITWLAEESNWVKEGEDYKTPFTGDEEFPWQRAKAVPGYYWYNNEYVLADEIAGVTLTSYSQDYYVNWASYLARSCKFAFVPYWGIYGSYGPEDQFKINRIAQDIYTMFYRTYTNYEVSPEGTDSNPSTAPWNWHYRAPLQNLDGSWRYTGGEAFTEFPQQEFWPEDPDRKIGVGSNNYIGPNKNWFDQGFRATNVDPSDPFYEIVPRRWGSVFLRYELGASAQLKLYAEQVPDKTDEIYITLSMRSDYGCDNISAVWLTNRTKMRVLPYMEFQMAGIFSPFYINKDARTKNIATYECDPLVPLLAEIPTWTHWNTGETIASTREDGTYGMPLAPGTSSAFWTGLERQWYDTQAIAELTFVNQPHSYGPVGNYADESSTADEWVKNVRGNYALNMVYAYYPAAVTAEGRLDTRINVPGVGVFPFQPNGGPDNGWYPVAMAHYKLLSGQTVDDISYDDIKLDENYIYATEWHEGLRQRSFVQYKQQSPTGMSGGLGFFSNYDWATNLTLINEHEWLKKNIYFYEDGAEGLELINDADEVRVFPGANLITDYPLSGYLPAGYTDGVWKVINSEDSALPDGTALTGLGNAEDPDKQSIDKMPSGDLSLKWYPNYKIHFVDASGAIEEHFQWDPTNTSLEEDYIVTLTEGENVSDYFFPEEPLDGDNQPIEDGYWTYRFGNAGAYTRIPLDVLTAITSSTTVADALSAIAGETVAAMPANNVWFRFETTPRIPVNFLVDGSATDDSPVMVSIGEWADIATAVAASGGVETPYQKGMTFTGWTAATGSPGWSAADITILETDEYTYNATFTEATITVNYINMDAAGGLEGTGDPITMPVRSYGVTFGDTLGNGEDNVAPVVGDTGLTPPPPDSTWRFWTLSWETWTDEDENSTTAYTNASVINAAVPFNEETNTLNLYANWTKQPAPATVEFLQADDAQISLTNLALNETMPSIPWTSVTDISDFTAAKGYNAAFEVISDPATTANVGKFVYREDITSDDAVSYPATAATAGAYEYKFAPQAIKYAVEFYDATTAPQKIGSTLTDQLVETAGGSAAINAPTTGLACTPGYEPATTNTWKLADNTVFTDGSKITEAMITTAVDVDGVLTIKIYLQQEAIAYTVEFYDIDGGHLGSFDQTSLKKPDDVITFSGNVENESGGDLNYTDETWFFGGWYYINPETGDITSTAVETGTNWQPGMANTGKVIKVQAIESRDPFTITILNALNAPETLATITDIPTDFTTGATIGDFVNAAQLALDAEEDFEIGFAFEGWTVAWGSSTADFATDALLLASEMKRANVTITAKAKAIEYAVEFYDFSGAEDAYAINGLAQTVSYADTLADTDEFTVPSSVTYGVGYEANTTVPWAYGENATTDPATLTTSRLTNAMIPKAVDVNGVMTIKIYAQRVKSSYTVKFIDTDGTTVLSTVAYQIDGENIAVPSVGSASNQVTIDDGYMASDPLWLYDNNDATPFALPTTGKLDAEMIGKAVDVSGDMIIEIYAQQEPKSYTIKFYEPGNATAISTQSGLTLEPGEGDFVIPSVVDYGTGWQVNTAKPWAYSNGDEAIISGLELTTAMVLKADGDYIIEIFAQRVKTDYEVTFYDVDGTTVLSTETYNIGDVIVIPSPNYGDGMMSDGWQYGDTTAFVIEENDDDQPILGTAMIGKAVDVSDTMTIEIYAQQTEIAYTVLFYDFDGSGAYQLINTGSDNEGLEIGDTVTVPTTVNYGTGYEAHATVPWAYGQNAVTDPATLTGPLTMEMIDEAVEIDTVPTIKIYAQRSPITYYVQFFNPDGGSQIGSNIAVDLVTNTTITVPSTTGASPDVDYDDGYGPADPAWKYDEDGTAYAGATTFTAAMITDKAVYVGTDWFIK